MVPQHLRVHDKRLERHELIPHRALAPHAVDVDGLPGEMKLHAARLGVGRSLPPLQGRLPLSFCPVEAVKRGVYEILVVARKPCGEYGRSADCGPVRGVPQVRPVLADEAPRPRDEVIGYVAAVGIGEALRLAHEVIANCDLDEPRRVAESLVEHLGGIVRETMARANAVVGPRVGVCNEQLPRVLGVLLVAEKLVGRTEVRDVEGKVVVRLPDLGVGDVFPLPIRALHRLRDGDGLRDAAVHRHSQRRSLSAESLGSLHHRAEPGNVLLVPCSAGMSL